ncbi:hypothetical protein HAX54_036008 [Datura stramonium]|uniref:Uncharacterized protein n=1 Tax=Datura stramonium TaxID=4076 RepID=A0ABS8SFZ8_DATST|nr:hypothetical protein [Datura stramonium]
MENNKEERVANFTESSTNQGLQLRDDIDISKGGQSEKEKVPQSSDLHGEMKNREDTDPHATNAGKGKDNRDAKLQVGNVVNTSQQITKEAGIS